MYNKEKKKIKIRNNKIKHIKLKELYKHKF